MKDFKNSYTAIACINNKGVLAKDGKELFDIKADKENFAMLTSYNVVIMGRKTFESLPGGKPLKNRINIILTTKDDYEITSGDEELYKDTYVCNSFQEVDDLCYAIFHDRELFIIGGGEIYQEAINLGIVDRAILTLVNDDQEGDVYFPDLSKNSDFRVIFKTMSLRDHPGDNYYRYVIYKKKS